MKDIEELLRMTERPQDYTDEKIQQLMDDPDMRTYYELMVSAEAGFAQRKAKRAKSMSLWKIAAMFVGILLLSGIAIAAVHMVKSNSTEELKSPTQEVRITNSHQQPAEATPSDSIRTFENVELQQILSELAKYYHVGVDYRNEQARHIRLYTKWDTTAPLSKMIERLNSFEKVNVRLNDNQIIAE